MKDEGLIIISDVSAWKTVWMSSPEVGKTARFRHEMASFRAWI